METKATSKGQIVIPADLRRRLGIKAGTRVSIRVDERENTIVLKPITREFIDGMRGIDHEKGELQALVDERRLEADWDLTKEAARLKSKYPVAYADCFAAALAKREGGRLVTGDPEFRRLDKEISVIWI